jgi:hypothetical protein
MSLLELFVNVDDFCQIFLPVWDKKLFADGSKKRRRTGQLSVRSLDNHHLLPPISIQELQGILHRTCLPASER